MSINYGIFHTMKNDNKLLISKIDNCISAVKSGKAFAFTPFLNTIEQSTVINHIDTKINYLKYGGYNDFDRCIIAIYDNTVPETYDFPIEPLCFKLCNYSNITHRDVLGALMSLGIKREIIGDIIFLNDACIFFVLKKMSQYILQNLLSVKNVSVSVVEYTGEINFTRSFEEKIILVSSMRLDCLVSEIVAVSRTIASDLILQSQVYLNGLQCTKKDKVLFQGDIISIHKKGKYKFSEVVGETKKGKLKIKILKYI